MLMSGGSASGKSEYVSVYLDTTPAIVLDGTLPTFEGAQIKIRAAHKHHKHVAVTAVMPVNLTIAFSAFLGRERKFSPEHFFRTHSASRQTLLQIAVAFPQIPLTLIDSEYNPDGTISFTQLIFKTRQNMIELLHRRQYTEQEIRNRVIHNAA
jgi:hypothetical protein